MSHHKDSVSLRQMLDHAREAVLMAQPHIRDDLDNNRMLTLALLHLVQIVGEAANVSQKLSRIVTERSLGGKSMDSIIVWFTVMIPSTSIFSGRC